VLLAGVLRLRSGQIMLATGVIAGIGSVRRMVRKTGVLDEVLQPDLAVWFYPEGDLQRAPAFWILTAAAVLVLALMARRGGAAPATLGEAGIPVSLKRVYPFAMPMTFAPLDVQLKCLWIARGHVAWAFLPRAIAVLILSTINTVLSLPEAKQTRCPRRACDRSSSSVSIGAGTVHPRAGSAAIARDIHAQSRRSSCGRLLTAVMAASCRSI
jgi:hypothetical protein